ncbi:ABC transporter ATP-binding protein [Deltaproteobacteria bacterium TL4]
MHILKGLNFSVNAGETVAIVGASGTGKSTFLHLLGGIDQTDQGEILVEDQNLSLMSSNQCALFRNRQIGFIFQFHHLLQDFTALENVMMPLLMGGSSLSTAQPSAMEILSEMGLRDRVLHKSSQLSGGEQQRVAIARAIINSPKILLADEPTGNLDQETGQQVIDLLLNLNKRRGITLIMITHNPRIAELMQFQYQMKDGILHKIDSTPL